MGILVCCGGMGLLLASDHITGSNGGTAANQLKGDLFMLLGSSCYGLDNVLEEFLVSKRPIYEVVGQIGFWGTIISGAQAGIFDRAAFRAATWDGKVGGYLVGYTGCLFIFCELFCLCFGAIFVNHNPVLPPSIFVGYTNDAVEDSFTPIMFRMSSAAFFNISLLTGNFWGVAIGTKVFGLHIHYLYPIAFVLIMVGEFPMMRKTLYQILVGVGLHDDCQHIHCLGLFVYFTLTKSVLGEAKKPWLGHNQHLGISGIGTARRKAEHPGAIV
jgi:solute carrier family 35 protein F1/2